MSARGMAKDGEINDIALSIQAEHRAWNLSQISGNSLSIRYRAKCMYLILSSYGVDMDWIRMMIDEEDLIDETLWLIHTEMQTMDFTIKWPHNGE